MLADFSKKIEEGKVQGIAPGVKFTTPVGLATTSQYVMIQSVAPGKTLKEHSEGMNGNQELIKQWRENIFRGVLQVFGYMSLGNGFWQTDPHNGNWFFDDSTN